MWWIWPELQILQKPLCDRQWRERGCSLLVYVQAQNPIIPVRSVSAAVSQRVCHSFCRYIYNNNGIQLAPSLSLFISLSPPLSHSFWSKFPQEICHAWAWLFFLQTFSHRLSDKCTPRHLPHDSLVENVCHTLWYHARKCHTIYFLWVF